LLQEIAIRLKEKIRIITNLLIEEKRKELFDSEVFVKQWEKQKKYIESNILGLKKEEEFAKKIVSEIKNKKDKIKQYTGNQNLEDDLKISEISIEDMLEEINKSNAIISSEKKALELLKKATSTCPTCDSNIGTTHKQKLINEKTITINKLQTIAKNLNEKVKNEKEIAIRLKEKIRIITNLLIEVSHENEAILKVKNIEKKINELKEDLNSKQIEEQLNKRNNLNEKIKEFIFQKNDIKTQIESLRKQNVFAEYSKISKKIEELLHNKNEVGDELNEIKSKLNERLGEREKVLIKENNSLETEIKTLEEHIKIKQEGIKELEEYVKKKDIEIDEAKKNSANLIKEKETLDKNADSIEKLLIELLSKIKKIESRLNEFNIEKGKIEVKNNDLNEEMKEFEKIEQIAGKEVSELKERVIEIEKRISTIGAVNMKAVDNFNELKKEVDEIQTKATQLENERLSVLDMIDKIEIKRTTVFMDCFNEVNKNFQEMFFNFFNGEGNLKLSNPDSPLISGLEIDAKHKGENLQHLDAMSGGEKTLTALAFMFAIQLYSPAPFYAFDEADAALDKENSLKMSKLIKMISKHSQFIAITHNDTLTKQADQIVGVALSKEKSSVIGLKLKSKDLIQNFHE